MKTALLSLLITTAFATAAPLQVNTVRMWVKTVASAATPEILTSDAPSTVVGLTTTATLYFASRTNYFRIGDEITVSGVSDPAYNGAFKISATGGGVATNSTISYTTRDTITNATPSAVGVSIIAHIPIRSMTFQGKKDRATYNTQDVYIGPSEVNNYQMFTIESNGEAAITMPQGQAFLSSNYYIDVQTANDGLVMYFY